MRNGCCGQGRGYGMARNMSRGCCGRDFGNEMRRRDCSCMFDDSEERISGGFGFREFLSKEERMELLKKRKESFEKEIKAMDEQINELQ